MEFIEILRGLDRYPSMYGVRSFEGIHAFLDGFDLARDGGPMAGFREWLIVRANGGNNLGWPGLVQLLTIPQVASIELSAEQDDLCRRAVPRLLSEYLAYREEVGLTKVFHDYGKWLLRHRWYTGPLRMGKRPKPR
jgi:hypothetical protein